jgi:hypothetical protein
MAAQISRLLITGTLIGGMIHCPVFADTVAAEKTMLIPEATVSSTFFGSAAINNDELEASRGGAELQVLNKSALDGVVSENQAYNLTTGSNWVTEGSFAGASGQSTLIQNSGNNVLIQNSTIINLQVK